MPQLNGNWIDLLILIFFVFYVWEGIERGFFNLLGEMVSFIIAFIAALRFYPFASKVLSDNFSLSLGFANAIGFVLVAVIVEAIIGVILSYLYRLIPARWFSSWWNRALGFLPAIVDVLILTGFVLTAIIGLPVSPFLKQDVLASRIGGALIKQTSGLESSLNNVFGGAIQETLHFITVTPEGRENIDLHFKTSDVTVDQTSEDVMFRLVNQERQKVGLPKLFWDTKLRDLARAHSRDMFVRGYFSHVDPDGHDPFQRMHAAGIQFEAAGENLAYAPSVQIAHEGLMNSPGHRANILSSDFHRIGIGVIDGGIYGKMFTQEFTN